MGQMDTLSGQMNKMQERNEQIAEVFAGQLRTALQPLASAQTMLASQVSESIAGLTTA